MKRILIFAACALILTACGTKKVLVDDTKQPTTEPKPNKEVDPSVAIAQFVKKVNDNAVYTKSISSKIDFTGKKTSVVVHSSKASGVLSVQFSRK